MERKIHNFESTILVDETINEYGYNPDSLGKSSAKFIMASCRFCGLPHKIRKGFFIKSGSACHSECRFKEMGKLGSPFAQQDVKDKIKKTNLERYGVEFASQNKDIAERISSTKKTEESKEKTTRTNIERYGVKNISQLDEVKTKTEQTNLIKFGVMRPLQNTEIYKKFKETMSSRIYPKHKNEFDKEKLITEVSSIIKNFGLETTISTRQIIPPLELDIYVPDKKFAIEFNGSYWHSEAVLEPKDARKKHRKKLDMCREKGVYLFNIFEHTWEKRKPQMLNFIKTILSQNAIKIGARECSIGEDPCKKFINDHHIQGHGQATIKYFNLVYKDEVIASMTASAHHRQNAGDNLIVLNRLCFKDGINVQGGSSKLFKYFIKWAKEKGYGSIVSWSDNCWTEGNIYKVLGFTLVREYDPDYFYWDINNKCYVSKQSKKKSNTGCPKDKTEREWCLENGFFRLYDCGKKKFQYIL